MKRYHDPEVRQTLLDEQDADLEALHGRLTRNASGEASGEGTTKETWLKEDAITPTPLPPRPWFRNIAYTRTGCVVVPRKPYHQQATFIGMNNVAFQISYNNEFLLSDTILCPGDRNTTVWVFAGQDVWMRSEVVDGTLGVIVQPSLGSLGQTLTTEGNGFMHEIPVEIRK